MPAVRQRLWPNRPLSGAACRPGASLQRCNGSSLSQPTHVVPGPPIAWRCSRCASWGSGGRVVDMRIASRVSVSRLLGLCEMQGVAASMPQHLSVHFSVLRGVCTAALRHTFSCIVVSIVTRLYTERVVSDCTGHISRLSCCGPFWGYGIASCGLKFILAFRSLSLLFALPARALLGKCFARQLCACPPICTPM